MADVAPIEIDEALLRAWKLPWPGADSDKEQRGRVLIVAGSEQLAGTAILSATGAMRAGAGKVRIATSACAAVAVAAAMPEARVLGLQETGGRFEVNAPSLAAFADRIDCALIGPGITDESSARELVRSLVPLLEGAAIVLDSAAMVACTDVRFARPPVLTPHGGEMAHLLGIPKDDVLADPARIAAEAARNWNAVVALKGVVTHVATPGGELWCNRAGNAGLGTCGSGDVLAGIIAGLAGRGATVAQATVWGVALHARAGDRLAHRLGTLGYLARELPGEIPALMEALR